MIYLINNGVIFQRNNLTVADFDVICGMVSWAVCGTGQSRDKNKQVKNEVPLEIRNSRYVLLVFNCFIVFKTSICFRDAEMKLTKQEKEAIGKKCKLLLNYGRFDYLKQLDFNCNLYYYVNSNVSLENVCIVACK